MISAVIVLAIAVAVGASLHWGKFSPNQRSPHLRFHRKPAHERAQLARHAKGETYDDAPWALSALPECWKQLRSVRGTSAFVGAHLPRGLQRVRSGSVMRRADCELYVRANGAVVTRGADRMYLPPPVDFYTSDSTLYLVERAIAGRGVELLVYGPPNAAGKR